jgi:ubiquinone/menaquinone biosynthesis C-methylase UbiE
MPAGIGSAGTILIVQLRELGHSLTDAIAITSLVRLTSAGAALSLGCAFLVREIRALRERGAHTMRVRGNGAGRHFDEIARDYDDQFSSHVWDHLMTGKLAMIESAVMPDIGKNAIMLDLGCGLGRQSGEMIRRGYKVTGVDLSERLLRYAVEAGVPVLSGDALRLPFADETFDVVYTIGVLHHLPDWNAQLAACAETHRVLKPGGRFLIHETNPRNPLFRFYMGYVFPLLKSIDEGTEVWIPPRLWKNVSGFTVQDVRYFTFLPDFVPRVLMGPLAALEKRLESSRLRSQSVHYLAVLEKGKTPAFNPSRATVPSSEFAPLRGA